MPPLVVVTISVLCIAALLLWRMFQSRGRLQSRLRRTPVRTPDRRRTIVPTLPAVPAASPAAIPEEEPLSCAFPVRGLQPGGPGAGALETILRRVAGVTTVYVSPVTALAYLAYLPSQVSEEQLAKVISDGGYMAEDGANRFDWQHRVRGPADGVPLVAIP